MSDFLSSSAIEGCDPLTLTGVHGFFCALASTVTEISPEEWIPNLFRGEPDFSSKKIQKIMVLLFRFQSQINRIFEEDVENERVELLIWDTQKNQPVYYIHAPDQLIFEWCDGYLFATSLDPFWYENGGVMKASEVFHPIPTLLSYLKYKLSIFNKTTSNIEKVNIKEEDYKDRLEFLPDEIYRIYLEIESAILTGHLDLSDYTTTQPLCRNDPCP